MNDEDFDTYLRREVVSTMQKRVDDTDVLIAQRLAVMRREAIAQAESVSGSDVLVMRGWVSYAGIFLFVCLVALVTVATLNPKGMSHQISPLETIEIIGSQQDVEISNDLEFFIWLDENADDTP